MVCLDTAFIVDLLREKKRRTEGRATKKWEQLMVNREIPRTTIITLAELYVGPYRVDDTAAELEKVERITEQMEILEFTPKSAKRFGKMIAESYKKGKPLGAMDAMIASIVIENDELFITRNIKDFQNIRGLNVMDY